jgi:hypothetical protein
MIMICSDTVEKLHTRPFAIEVNQEFLTTNGRTDTPFLSKVYLQLATRLATPKMHTDYDVLLFSAGKNFQSSVRC